MITSEDLIYAEKLRALRRTSGWKQLLAAENIGMHSQQEYSKLENGKMHFSEERIRSICKAYNIKVSDFKRTEETEETIDHEKLKKSIRERRVLELENKLTKRGLLTLAVSAERNRIEHELELIQLKLNQLMPPKFEDVPEDKEYKIYVML